MYFQRGKSIFIHVLKFAAVFLFILILHPLEGARNDVMNKVLLIILKSNWFSNP